MFEHAGMHCTVLVTQHAGHATQVVSRADLRPDASGPTPVRGGGLISPHLTSRAVPDIVEADTKAGGDAAAAHGAEEDAQGAQGLPSGGDGWFSEKNSGSLVMGLFSQVADLIAKARGNVVGVAPCFLPHPKPPLLH